MMDKVKVLLVCSLFVSTQMLGQFQLGQTLFEWYSGSIQFRDIDVSQDGTIFVLNNYNEREVKVFELVGKEWKQKGETFNQVSAANVVISGDGNTIFLNELTRIHVHKWDGNKWIESVNQEIIPYPQIVESISVSSSGNRISLSSIDRFRQYCTVEVLEWKDSRWQTLGDKNIIKWLNFHWEGASADLSGDGSTIAIGHAGNFGPEFGLTEVYKYSGEEWLKMGESIRENTENPVGVDVSISYDGKVIAISARGKIHILKWNGQGWVTKGAQISTQGGHTCTVKLDSSGNRLAFANNTYSTNEDFLLGKVELLKFDGSRYSSIGPQVEGEQGGDKFGSLMGLSGDGEVLVAVSDPSSYTRMSYIKAYKFDGVPFSPISFISGSSDACDYERVAHRSQFTIEFKGGQTYQYYLDGSSNFMLPIWDSIFISPKVPQNYRAVPEVSIIDSITLEAYKAKPGTYIRDSFCLIPLDESITDIRIDIIIPQNARPGFSFPVLLKYTNVGTVTVSGNVEFYFDGQLQTITSTNPAHDVLGSNHLRWNYEDLLPLESREIELTFELNRPTANPPLNGGERLLYSAKVEPVNGDINPHDNQTESTIRVVNAYDPNDKRCMQGDTIHPESVGRPLTYVIRFENVGTAEAIDVRIRDVIDTSMLDISTFEMLDASHDGYMVQISEGNIIDFIFKGINLPFDDENNDGYVAFNMHTKEHLQIGDAVKNDAAIYFDYNYPVITNEMITLVADQTTSIPPVNPQLGLSVYPNPASDIARVSASATIMRIDLIDMQGRQLRQEVYINGGDKTRELSVTGLSQGTYWLRVTTEEGVGTIPLMVK